MLDIAKKTCRSIIVLRLNTIPNASYAIANDVQYHLKCWVNIKRQAESDSIGILEIVDIERVLADIETANTVQITFMDSTDTILDINMLKIIVKVC